MGVTTIKFTLVALVWEQTSATTWRSMDHPHVRGYIQDTKSKIGFMLTVEIGRSKRVEAELPTLGAARQKAYQIIGEYISTFIEQ